MTSNYAAAIIRWRDQLQMLEGGLSSFDNSATISTMLFGCHRWLKNHAHGATQEQVDRIETIKGELESWMRQRGLDFVG